MQLLRSGLDSTHRVWQAAGRPQAAARGATPRHRTCLVHALTRACLQARNFAVMTGVNAGVAAFMKRWRGKDDINNQLVCEWAAAGRGHVVRTCRASMLQCRAGSLHSQGCGLCARPCKASICGPAPHPPTPNPTPPHSTHTPAAAFFSGSAFSLVSGGISGGAAAVPGAPPPNPLMAAFSAGVVFALFNGAFYKARQSCMLSAAGLGRPCVHWPGCSLTTLHALRRSCGRVWPASMAPTA